MGKTIELSKGIDAAGLGIWIKKEKALIISDIHLGYDAHIISKGIMIPRFQLKKCINMIDDILYVIGTKPKIFIINGDIKHEFGKISQGEWRDVLEFIDHLKKKIEKIIIVKGNHDIIIEPLLRKRGVESVKGYLLGDKFIAHGDHIPDSEEFRKSRILIMGHEHPMVSLREGRRYEKFKAFLVGRWRRKILIVQPSFNPLVEGSDVLHERSLSPFLKEGIEDYRAYLYGEDEKVYDFGKIRRIRDVSEKRDIKKR